MRNARQKRLKFGADNYAVYYKLFWVAVSFCVDWRKRSFQLEAFTVNLSAYHLQVVWQHIGWR